MPKILIKCIRLFIAFQMMATAFSVVFVLNISTVLAFNSQINYQGKISDNLGNALNDSYNIRVRLCNNTNCDSVLWTEERVGGDKVTVRNGLFSIMLGEVESLNSLDFNQTLYLEVAVGGTGVPSWEILLPRKILGSVPNAFNAQKLDGLATTSFLRADAVNERATITALTSTDFFATNASITNATSTNLFTSILNALSAVIDNLTATIANITTLVFGSAIGNDLTVTDLNVTSTANILNLNATSSNFINTTSTNFYSSNAIITGGEVASSTISGLITSNFASSNVSQWTNDSGYLTSFTESDPLFMSASTSLPYQPIGSYLTDESDPIWMAASSSYLTITSASSTYLAIGSASTTLWDSTYLTVNTSSTYWDTAYSWGNHADGGYLTSYTESDPIWMAASSSYLTVTSASSTYLAIGSASTTLWDSTYLTVNASSTYWDTAHSWGNHADGGYLTSYTESDPIWMAASSSLTVSNFTSANISQWTNDASYLTTWNETDPIFMAASTSLPYQPIGSYLTDESDPIWMAASSSYLTVTSASSTYLAIGSASTTLWDSTYLTVNTSSTYWNTAYSWGNHADGGYAVLSANNTFTGVNSFATTSFFDGGFEIKQMEGLTFIGNEDDITGVLNGFLFLATGSDEGDLNQPMNIFMNLDDPSGNKGLQTYDPNNGGFMFGVINSNFETVPSSNYFLGDLNVANDLFITYGDFYLNGVANINQLNATSVVSNLLPSTNLIYSLGSSIARWDNLWVNNINSSGNVNIAGELQIENGLNFSGSLQKIADNLILPISIRNLYVADNYAYVVTYATNSLDSFRIIDISNPSHPKIVGGQGISNLPNRDAKRVYAVGNYAYVLYHSDLDNEAFRIINISNKSNPVVVGGENLSLPGFDASDGQPFYVSGNYAYIMASTKIYIVDISNPHNPTLVGSLADIGDKSWDVKVVGDYAYICGREVVEGDLAPLSIVNIKNKNNPVLVSKLKIPDIDWGCWSLDVMGSYAYLGLGNISEGSASSTDLFRIVDISNPADPQVVGGSEFGINDNPSLALAESYGGLNYLKVLGNRLYATTWESDFLVIDVASSTNPKIITKKRIADDDGINYGPLTFDLRGNYVILGYAPIHLPDPLESNAYFRIYKLPSVDIWGGHADSFSIGAFQAYNNAVFNQRVSIWDSLEVGSGGIFSQGPIAISSTSTINYFGGSIGIGTTTPTYRLSVYSDNATDYLLQVATSTNSSIFEIRNDGIARFGGDLIVSGVGTSTFAGNVSIAEGKTLQVSNIVAYSPLNINTDLIVSGNSTTTGNLIVSGDISGNNLAVTDWNSAYSIVNASSTYWDTAHSWGNHGEAGYAVLSANNTFTGTTTLATTSMAFGSKIGETSNYFEFTNFNVVTGMIAGTKIPVINALGDFWIDDDGTPFNLGTKSFGFGSYGSIIALPLDQGPFTVFTEEPSNPTFGFWDFDEGMPGVEIFWDYYNLEDPIDRLVYFTGADGYHFDVAITEASDRSFKTNINDLGYGLEEILGLRPVSFDYISNGKASIGFIAQEVKEILPELVHGKEGSYGLNYSVMTSLLTRGIQQQQQQIEDLKVFVGFTDDEELPVAQASASESFNNLSVSQSATFYGTITVIGEAGFRSKVTFEDHVYFNEDMAGTAIIDANATSTEIKFAKAYEVTPIITITPRRKMAGISWWVENETEEGFVIAVDPTFSEDLQFNWHAIAVKKKNNSSQEPSSESIEIEEENNDSETQSESGDDVGDTEEGDDEIINIEEENNNSESQPESGDDVGDIASDDNETQSEPEDDVGDIGNDDGGEVEN